MLRRQQAGQDQEGAKGEEFRADDLDNPPDDAEPDLVNLKNRQWTTPVAARLVRNGYKTPSPVKL
jgi:hypothetical protein